MLKVGEIAPEIDAVATNGERFVLSRSPARCTVVYFFPKAFTPGCTAEAKLFGKDHVELLLAGARVVGISTDDHTTQCKFAADVRAPFPMIADADGKISKAFGVLWPILKVAHRATFVVDPTMTVVLALKDDLSVAKHRDEALRAVDMLARGRAANAAQVDTEREDVTAPVRLGRYALFTRLASGGMGSVHLGRLLGEGGFSRTVAIKRLHPHLVDQPAFAEMMIDEARMAARIHHPNVVATLDVVEEEREVVVVMEYVHGESLATLRKITADRGERIPARLAATIVAGALHGLHAAHEATDELGAPLRGLPSLRFDRGDARAQRVELLRELGLVALRALAIRL